MPAQRASPSHAMVQNKMDGPVSGFELWRVWRAMGNWRVSGGLTTLHKALGLQPDSNDPVGPRNMGNDSHYQWTFRSAFNLPSRQELDMVVRRVGVLPVPEVPACTAVDVRYGWRVLLNLELSISLRTC